MNRIRKEPRTGFTVMEILVSTLIVTIVALPAILIFRMGTGRSTQGMMRINATLEARQVLQRIRQDLEAAAFPTKNWNVDVVKKEQLLDIVQPPPFPEYRLLCFPRQSHSGAPGNEAEAGASRLASRITWRLEKPVTEGGEGTLVREEEANPASGGAKKTFVVCRRVNAFSIHRETIDHSAPRSGNSSWVTLYRINLQIIASPQGSSAQAKATILDFVETIVPEFLHGKGRDPFGSQNWHSGISGFTDQFEPPW